mgnify:CR=1 FL=1
MILVLAEHDNASVKPATHHAVAAAAKLSGEIHVLVAGHDAAGAAKHAAAIGGVAKVLHVDAAHLAQPTAENLAAQILAVVAQGGYTHLVAPATGSGKNVMPRVAAKLDVAQLSDITGIESADTFVRPIYAGNAFATVQSKDAVKVITVRTTAFESAGSGGSAAVESVAAVPAVAGARVTGQELTKSERPELTSARVVVSGGRGLGNGENYHKLLEPLADRLNAALGASRAALARLDLLDGPAIARHHVHPKSKMCHGRDAATYVSKTQDPQRPLA